MRTIAGREWELAHERPSHDNIACPQPAPVGAKLAREPGYRLQRVAEYSRTQAGCHLLPIEEDLCLYSFQVQITERLCLAQDHAALLRVIRQREGHLR